MPASFRTFRVFVSSTFSDLKAERDYLQDHIYPRLRYLCARHGCRFQAIDLRWGVSEEAALDQQTLNICLEELRRCQHASPRPNFIVLLGQRYGWCPLPPQIEAREFEELLSTVESVDDKVLLSCPAPPGEPQLGRHWYRRDDNAVPPEYVLRPRELLVPDGGSKDERAQRLEREAEEWRYLESRMRQILLSAADELGWPERDPRRTKYERSATHHEIAAGALSSEVERPEDHVFCFVREVADLPSDASAATFIDINDHGNLDADAADRLLQLKATLKKRLREKTPENDGNVHAYPATWTGVGPTLDHLEKLGNDVFESLSRVILNEVVPVDRRVDDDPEVFAHETFGNKRIEVFEGREDLLDQIRGYIDIKEPHPLVLHGVSGCGKTALIAKAASDAMKAVVTDARKKVVCRFIGATPASTSLRSLLEGLCRQIGPTEGELPGDIRELGEEFSRRLEETPAVQPLVLFLDALDQLGEADGARTLWWLPTDLPANVRLIVSVLDAEGGPGDCSRAVAGRMPASSLVPVGPLAAIDGERILERWLRRASRRLQPEQRADVMAKFSAPGNGLPLYLKLASEEVRRWKSFDGVPRGVAGDPGLGADVQRVLKDLLRRLARDEHHGPVFTERALGCLAAGRQGLTEDELVDVLSQDVEVLRNFQERSPKSPTVNRLPFIIWSRLRSEMEPYLTERHADNTTVLDFYHRQVRDAVEERYLAGDSGVRAHRELASYFHRQESFLESIEEQRLRAKRFPPTPRPANLRKADELAWQRLRGQQTANVADLLTDLVFLEAKSEAGMVFDLVRDFTEYLRTAPADESRRPHIELLLKALRRDVHFIARRPTTLFQCLWNSGWWHDCPDAAQHYESADGPWSRRGDKLSSLLEAWRSEKERAMPGFMWLRSKRPPPTSLDAPELAVLRGHHSWISGLAVMQDSARLVSASYDKTIRVWDTATSESLAVLRGHEGWVRSVVVTRDSSHIISADDRTVRVWDATTGAEVAILRGHEGDVTCVAVTPDGRRIVTGGSGSDPTLRIWAFPGGERLAVLRGHTGRINCIALTSVGGWILSGSDDGTVRIWDATTGATLAALRSPGSLGTPWILCLCAVPDSTYFVSGANDGAVRVWDAATQMERAAFRGHEGEVKGVALTPDGARVISASEDRTVRIWDMATGGELAVLRHECWVECVSVTPDGTRIVSGGSDGGIRLWDAVAGPGSVALRGHVDDVLSVVVSQDEARIASGSLDGTVRVWDAVTGREVAVLRGHESPVLDVVVTEDGRRIISGSVNGIIRTWDAATGVGRAVIRGPSLQVHGLISATADGAHIISGDLFGTVRIWDSATGEEVMALRGHEGMVRTVTVTPDGKRIVSGSDDGTVRIWDVATGTEHATLRGHTGRVLSVAVTPDGTRVVSGAEDGTVRNWNSVSGAQLAVLHGHKDWVERVAMTPDGARLASGSRQTTRLWNGESGSCLRMFLGDGDLNAIAAGPLRFPLLALARGAETVVESSASGEEVASFPEALHDLVTYSSCRAWVGVRGNHLFVLALEGTV